MSGAQVGHIEYCSAAGTKLVIAGKSVCLLSLFCHPDQRCIKVGTEKPVYDSFMNFTLVLKWLNSQYHTQWKHLAIRIYFSMASRYILGMYVAALI